MDEPFTTTTIRAKQQMDELLALAPRLTGQPPPGAQGAPGMGGGAPGAPRGGSPPPGAPAGAPPGSTGPQMGPGGPTQGAPGAPPQPMPGGPVPPGQPQGQPDPALRARMLEMQNPLAALTARYLSGGQRAQQ